MTGTKRSDCLAWILPAGGSDPVPLDVRMSGSADTATWSGSLWEDCCMVAAGREERKAGRHDAAVQGFRDSHRASGMFCGLALDLPALRGGITSHNPMRGIRAGAKRREPPLPEASACGERQDQAALCLASVMGCHRQAGPVPRRASEAQQAAFVWLFPSKREGRCF